jgi:hypothetical protein
MTLAPSLISREISLSPSARSDFFGLQARAQRVHFLTHETAEGVEALGHVLAQSVERLGDGVFQAREAFLVIAHLRAEQYVADLVNICAFRDFLVGRVGNFRRGCHFPTSPFHTLYALPGGTFACHFGASAESTTKGRAGQ